VLLIKRKQRNIDPEKDNRKQNRQLGVIPSETEKLAAVLLF
jgi:hypothetical protein